MGVQLAKQHGAGGMGRQGEGNQGIVRRQRMEDDKLWGIALTDARVMADLSRAMSRDALRDTRGWRGVTGVHNFDRRGNVTDKEIVIQVVRNGKFEYVLTSGNEPS